MASTPERFSPTPDDDRPHGSAHRDADDYPVVVDADAAYAEEERDDGRPRLGGSRRWWLIGGLLVAAATALMVWIGVANAQDNVAYRDIGYHVDSPSQVTARWQVDKPRDKAVRCTVRALDQRFGVVGSVDVTVPAGQESVLTTTRIRTTSLAVTGTVHSCVLDGESR